MNHLEYQAACTALLHKSLFPDTYCGEMCSSCGSLKTWDHQEKTWACDTCRS